MKSPIAIAALTLAAALAAQAAAQPAKAPAAKPASGAPVTNSKAPIDITSDQTETYSANCTAIFTGAAEALQDASRLRADVMIGHQEILKRDKVKPGAGTSPGASCGDTISLEAKGHVYYAAADGRRVHGDNAIYDYASTTITITGDVTAVDGQNVMRGTKMVYNTQTGEGHMEGSAKGAGAKNRPRGVFYPKDASTDASATTATGAATDATPAATTDKPKKKKAAK